MAEYRVEDRAIHEVLRRFETVERTDYFDHVTFYYCIEPDPDGFLVSIDEDHLAGRLFAAVCGSLDGVHKLKDAGSQGGSQDTSEAEPCLQDEGDDH